MSFDRILQLRGWPVVFTAFVFSVVGCGTTSPFVWVGQVPPDNEVRKIATGDTIQVIVKAQAELSGDFVVSENGTYAQPVLGPTKIVGLSEVEAAEKVAQALASVVSAPEVTVTVTVPRPVRVSVTGEVNRDGTYTVQFDATLLSVLAVAGGLTPFADRNSIFIIRTRPKLMRIRFRYDDLKGGESASTLFRLRDGDVVVVE